MYKSCCQVHAFQMTTYGSTLIVSIQLQDTDVQLSWTKSLKSQLCVNFSFEHLVALQLMYVVFKIQNSDQRMQSCVLMEAF